MAAGERHRQDREGQEGAGYRGHPAKGSTRGRAEQKGLLAAPHRPWELCCAVWWESVLLLLLTPAVGSESEKPFTCTASTRQQQQHRLPPHSTAQLPQRNTGHSWLVAWGERRRRKRQPAASSSAHVRPASRRRLRKRLPASWCLPASPAFHIAVQQQRRLAPASPSRDGRRCRPPRTDELGAAGGVGGQRHDGAARPRARTHERAVHATALRSRASRGSPAGVGRARDTVPRQPRLVPLLPEGLALAGREARAVRCQEGDISA
jgi:hypothetical protein